VQIYSYLALFPWWTFPVSYITETGRAHEIGERRGRRLCWCAHRPAEAAPAGDISRAREGSMEKNVAKNTRSAAAVHPHGEEAG
jgi:hypothetical protein